jgi:hypothetical protein
MAIMFARFIDERRQAVGGAPMTDAEKAALFQQFQSSLSHLKGEGTI